MNILRIINLLIKDGKPLLIFLKGLPGSGKSTLAKELLDIMPNTDIISKDIIRHDMCIASGKTWYKNDKEWTVAKELVIMAERDKRILASLALNHNIIIDDCNFNPIHEERIKEIIGDKARFEEIVLDTPISKCVLRDKSRDEFNRVGPQAIWAMYKQYIRPKNNRKIQKRKRVKNAAQKQLSEKDSNR
jgi:tRNA uridine 5-carbamoylmethylation protein Kti12